TALSLDIVIIIVSTTSAVLFTIHGFHIDLNSFPTRRSSDLFIFCSTIAEISGGVNALSTFGTFTCTRPCASVTISYGTRLLSSRSEEHTSELQSRENHVCRLLLEKKNSRTNRINK